MGVALVAWAALISGVAVTQFDPTSLDELSQLEALQAIDPGVDDHGGHPLPSAALLPSVRMVADRWGAGAEEEPEAVANAADMCVSVAPGTTDNWCQLTCAAQECPESLCKCGDNAKELKASKKAANKANAAASGSAPVDEQKWDDAVTTNSSCISIQSGTNDYWCQITCGTAGGCPDNMCKCGDEKALKKKAKEDLIMSQACDFEANGCISIGGVMEDCRTCAAHFTGCMASPKVDENNMPQTPGIDECIDEVADQAKGCKECKTDESKAAWRLRVGDGMEAHP
jgi:hypothetical protein|tara:strand:- start:308 stop:1162 length:855 start_codon:yes stop_codon:yes gene_type:complete